MQGGPKHTIMRFVIPVALENVVTVFIGILFSLLMGKISPSALAATNSANLVVTLYVSMFSMLTTGSAVLTARLIGAREAGEATRTIEQSILMTLTLSLLLTLISVVGAPLIIRTATPSADAQLYSEAVRYFRVISLSLPGLMLWNTLVSVLRASGNSRAPLIIAIAVNIAQIAFAYLFIVVFQMNVLGAALAFVLCRMIGGVTSYILTVKSHASFYIHTRNILRPHFPTIRRIVRVGLPTCIEQTFIQIGYVVANALVIGLGTAQASIYNVANSMSSFTGIPITITGAMATTFVGQFIGAKKMKEAKSFGLRTFLICIPVVLVLYTLIAIISPVLAPLYTEDPAVIAGSTKASWVLIGYALPVAALNTIDPSLRAGGDGKFVMLQTLIGVWLFRLPLTWILGYVFKMGVNGVYLANIIAMGVRGVIGLFRFARDKWLYQRV